jgi:hypothetical protein
MNPCLDTNRRIEIAKLRGWTPDEDQWGNKGEWDTRDWFARKPMEGGSWLVDVKVPDYLNNLNATHELELWIQKEKGAEVWLRYLSILRRTAKGWGGAGAEVSATAKEKVVAMLIMFGRESEQAMIGVKE